MLNQGCTLESGRKKVCHLESAKLQLKYNNTQVIKSKKYKFIAFEFSLFFGLIKNFTLIFIRKETMEKSEDNQKKSYWFLKFVSEKISKVKSTLLEKLDPGMRLIHQK